MDFLNLIDTKSVVSKYSSFSDPAKMVSMTLLGDPQVLLCATLKSKNQLNVLVNNFMNILDAIYALRDSFTIFPKPLTNLEGLDNIQLALTNTNLNRTLSARIDDFLNSNLSHIKSSGDFLLNRNEAMQDIVTYISGILSLHSEIKTLLDNIINAIPNIESIDFSKNIKDDIKNTSIETLNNIKNEINQTSPISVATEILGIKAAQTILLNKVGVLDPFFDSNLNRNVSCFSENVNALITSSTFPVTITSGTMDISIDGGIVQSKIYPSSVGGVFGNCCLISTISITSVIVPPNSVLYLNIIMNGNPGPKQFTGYPKNIIPIPFIAGANMLSDIVLAINNGLNALDTTLTTRSFGRCTEFAIAGSGIIMIYGASDVIEIDIVPDVPGSYSLGVYNPPTTTSCHSLLGFTDYQKSFLSTVPNIDSMMRFINLAYSGITSTKSNNQLTIKSNSNSYDSSLLFSNTLSSELGFPGQIIVAKPSFISIVQDSSPFNIGVKPNFSIVINEKSYTVSSVDSDKLFIDNLDPIPLSSFKVMTDIQDIVPKLSSTLSSIDFSIDMNELQRLSIPLFSSNYSVYQISDFYKYVDNIKTQILNLKNALQLFPMDKSNAPSEDTLASITSFLQSKGLDNMLTNIMKGSFTDMFDIPSLSEGIMSNIEALGNSVVVEVIQDV